MVYRQINVRCALNRVSNNNLPYKWDLNVYRGCEHACEYCYAKYSNRYLDSKEHFREVFIKDNIIEVLEKKLSSRKWKRELVNLGSITDSYQPVEAKKKLCQIF